MLQQGITRCLFRITFTAVIITRCPYIRQIVIHQVALVHLVHACVQLTEPFSIHNKRSLYKFSVLYLKKPTNICFPLLSYRFKIFAHLKLWLATATHSFKWSKFEIKPFIRWNKIKELSNCKTRMPGTVKCRPTLAYWAGLGSITIDDYDYDYDYMSFLFIDYDYDYDYSSL